MSGDFDDGCAAVWHERRLRARKPHTCTACGETIAPGQHYTRHVRVNERGDKPELWKRCDRCETIYAHLRSVAGCDEDEPDPALNCGHTYEEIHGREPPPEIAALAFALPGEVTR